MVHLLFDEAQRILQDAFPVDFQKLHLTFISSENVQFLPLRQPAGKWMMDSIALLQWKPALMSDAQHRGWNAASELRMPSGSEFHGHTLQQIKQSTGVCNVEFGRTDPSFSESGNTYAKVQLCVYMHQ